MDLIICSIDRCKYVTKDRCKYVTKDFLYYPEAKLAATKTIFGQIIMGPLKLQSFKLNPKKTHCKGR